MAALRRHLRLFVTAWLIFQAASYSTLVPRDCCAAHGPVQAKAACHDAALPAVAGDIHATHYGGASDDADACTMTGGCDGPMSGFLAQLSLQGVLTDPLQIVPAFAASRLVACVHEDLVRRLVPPDSPPPRA